MGGGYHVYTKQFSKQGLLHVEIQMLMVATMINIVIAIVAITLVFQNNNNNSNIIDNNNSDDDNTVTITYFGEV